MAPSCHHSRLGESIPADVLAGRLAAAPAGQSLPPQVEEGERVGGDEGVREAVAQNAVIQNARAVKGHISGMTEKELAAPHHTTPDSSSSSSTSRMPIKEKDMMKRPRKDSSSEGSSSEDSEEGSEDEGSDAEGSEEEGSDAEGSEEGGTEERDGEDDGDDT